MRRLCAIGFTNVSTKTNRKLNKIQHQEYKMSLQIPRNRLIYFLIGLETRRMMHRLDVKPASSTAQPRNEETIHFLFCMRLVLNKKRDRQLNIRQGRSIQSGSPKSTHLTTARKASRIQRHSIQNISTCHWHC